MKMIFLGAPGAGKGTQADIFSKKLSIPTISTGNILRAAIADGTETGMKAKSYMDKGQLVPDEVILGIIKERLEKPDCQKGYILDGVPRTLAQAQALEDMGVKFDKVVSIEVADEVIVKRMTGRRTCTKCGATYHVEAAPPKAEGVCDNCGGALIQRPDDSAETVLHRLEVFHEQTEPLKEFYAQRGVLTLVDNQPTIDATTQAICKALGL